MPDVLNGKLLSAMHLLHACLNLPTLLPLAFPHSEINDLQGRGGASNVCTGCLLCGLLLFSTCDRREPWPSFGSTRLKKRGLPGSVSGKLVLCRGC